MTNRVGGIRRTILLLALLPAPLMAQAGTVRAKDNLRASPNGDVVAVLEPGTAVTVASRRDRWLEVELEAWVWMRSLHVVNSQGYDLIVSAAEGENLRTQPSGEIFGRMEKGTLLAEQERIPGWIRARRKGWIWAESVELTPPANTAATAPVRPPATGATARLSAPTKAAPPPAQTKAAPTPAPTRAASKTAEATNTPRPTTGAAILSGPNGDTLARMRPGAQLQVVARQGSWARVRVDGWTWLPALDSTSDAVVVKIDPAALAAAPESFRGRVVSWDLQFLSVERAEKIRTDFFEGEPFLLTRHSGGGYVYVAVPPERLGEVRNLLPLERITVIGRVRAPASTLTGSPILDLLEFSRTGDR